VPPPAPIEVVDPPSTALDLMRGWLSRRLPVDAVAWLEDEIGRQREKPDERRLGMVLGLVGRRVGRTDLALSTADVAAAQSLRGRWRPEFWGTDEAARVALIMATWTGDAELFARRIEALCATGELTEQIACFKGFAIFPAPERLIGRAREAVRSSIQPVFEAMACCNPYPADHFEAAAYNQMVVKCVFSGVPIEKIVGVDERRNDDMLRMLRDLVSERRAAGRVVPTAVHEWIGRARLADEIIE
jgi:hypothetical protein